MARNGGACPPVTAARPAGGSAGLAACHQRVRSHQLAKELVRTVMDYRRAQQPFARIMSHRLDAPERSALRSIATSADKLILTLDMRPETKWGKDFVEFHPNLMCPRERSLGGLIAPSRKLSQYRGCLRESRRALVSRPLARLRKQVPNVPTRIARVLQQNLQRAPVTAVAAPGHRASGHQAREVTGHHELEVVRKSSNSSVTAAVPLPCSRKSSG